MRSETIDRYMDECGITPGEWYVDVCNSGESCWCRTVGTDAKDEYGEELYILPSGACGKADAHIIAASREMLKALIGIALMFEKTLIDPPFRDTKFGNPVINSIEKALKKQWTEIKKRLEELDSIDTQEQNIFCRCKNGMKEELDD